MSPSRLLPFAVLSLVLIVIPGPSVLFIVGRALAVGRREILFTVAGNACGEYFQVVAVAFGVGLLLERSVAAFTAVKLLGAAYLIGLGVRSLMRRSAGLAPAAGGGVGTAAAFWQGTAVGASNPKTTVFFVAFLPQFVQRGGFDPAVQILILGLMWTGIALVSDSAWGFAAARAKNWLAGSPGVGNLASSASGLVMVGLGLGLAASGSRS